MFRNHTAHIAALLTLLSTVALPQTGFAASYLDTINQRAPKTVYTSSLADITNAESHRATRTLDWQRPSIELFFDLPPGERTSEIVLTLSADPLTRVAKDSPLEVQFNNSKPVPVRSNGRGFEARLPFDASKSRNSQNVIRITYPTPTGADCVTPSHGAWSVDLSASTLRIGGRAQKRHMNLSEISEYLAQPALTPKTVGLLARGPAGTDMQALAAQGIALRTPDVPNFSVTPRGNDFNVIMVKRNRLFEYTDEPMIINSEGPRIFIPRGRPTNLVFTADTDAELVNMLQIFATRKLPNTRRAISSLGEINLQNRLGSETVKIDKKSKLIDLAVPTNIAAGAQSYNFGVLDPATSSGEVLLRLTSTEKMADNSRLSVALNGQVLGAAKLDKRRKTVAFEIKPGTLNATSNVLNIVPDLKPEAGFSCFTNQSLQPEFFVGENSRITLDNAAPSPVTELSRLTSTGGLFAETESYIALPKNTRDYQAALRILGRLAKSAGQGLILADYTRDTQIGTDKHVLLIGPANMTKSHLSGAPKAVRDAMSGQSSTGDNLLEANFENYASAGTTNDAVKYAATQSGPRRVSHGGLAALYGSENGRLTGVISSTPGQSFVRSSNNLVELNHWNALRGGVARWSSSTVVMAQTAQSDTGIILPIKKKSFDFPELGLSGLNFPELSWPELSWPELSWPDVDWPEFDIPRVSLPEITWPSFNSDKTVEAKEIEIVEQDVAAATTKPIQAAQSKAKKIAEARPRPKPAFKSKSKTISRLRGTFQFDVDTAHNENIFKNIQRGTKEKWSATKRWFKAKAQVLKNMRTVNDIAYATDDLQDSVSPAGRSLKATLQNKLPGKGLVQIGDRTISVYGLILIMAFGLVLLLMSLSKPTSRLGGRH